MTNTVDLMSFRPLDPDIQQCPFDYHRAMRAEAPLLRIDGGLIGRPGEDVYCVSRHEDVLAVLRDPRTFSSRFGTPAAKVSASLAARLREVDADGWPNVSTMLTEDPPSHTRYRRLVSSAFTARRVAELEPEIRRICEDLVDRFDGQTQIEFLGQFGALLPIRAVAAILQVPDDHQQDFKRWATASVAAIGRAISDEERVAAQHVIVEQQHYFAAQLEERRVDPRDDFLTDLLNATLDGDDGTPGGPLNMAEMLSIIRQIQVAGSETTASLLADLMVVFAQAPDQFEAIRRDPSRIVSVVEEALRFASPNQGLFRIVTTDTTVAGQPVPAGATLWVMFGSANRDERTFADPDSFDPNREGLGRHIAFGKGIHVCLGAALARLEARVALETLAKRIQKIELHPDASLRYAPSAILRGLERLDLVLTYDDTDTDTDAGAIGPQDPL